MEQDVKINPTEIPECVFDAGCRILSKSVRAYFSIEPNRDFLNEWKKTREGQRASLNKKEREQFNLEYERKRGSKTAICCICGKEYSGCGNTAQPVANGECCDNCNFKTVVPARLLAAKRLSENIR